MTDLAPRPGRRPARDGWDRAGREAIPGQAARSAARPGGVEGAGGPSDDDGGALRRGVPPRGRRATSHGQNFGAVVQWTVLGALIPGLGLVVTGLRRLGWLVLGAFCALAVAVVAYVVPGDRVLRFGELIARPDTLLVLAGVLGVVLVFWATVVLTTHVRLRQMADLGVGQRILATLLVTSLVALIAFPAIKVGSYAVILRDTITGIFTSGTQGSVATGTTRKVKSGGGDPWADIPRVNVLLIGSDAGADRVGIRPDTLILASIDTKTGDTVLFSLPRNLQRVPFPLGSPQEQLYPNGFECRDANGVPQCLLNAFWTFGEENWQRFYSGEPSAFDAGLRATADAVSEVTGLEVNQYAMLNLRGFMQFVDALGGITVNVYERLPIGGSSEHPVASDWIEPGPNQHLDGYHALWFARSRWSTDDFDRMRRQRCVIGAVVREADPATIAWKFPQIAAAAKDNIITGIPKSDLSAWVTLTERVKKATVRSLPFTSRVINTENPDFALIHEMVRNAIDPATATATPSPTGTPSTAPSTRGNGSGAQPGASTPAKEEASGAAQDINQVC